MTSKVILYIVTQDDDVTWLEHFNDELITQNYNNFITTIDL